MSSRVCTRCGTPHNEADSCPDLYIGSGEDPFGVKNDARIGSRIERYELVERLGSGGMGVVYKALDTQNGSDVALKLLHRELTIVPQVVERFFREARATLDLQSEHIVRASDFGRTQDNDCFLVMELLPGQSLKSVLKEEKQLALPRALHIALQATKALRSAHERGVVHRDLKPANIQLIPRNGDPDFVKVLDFGIAKIVEAGEAELTRTGMILGSPAYMSPEQAASKDIDHRADIYALGTVLYEMLVGAAPFAGQSPAQTLLSQINSQPRPPREHRPELPVDVEQLVLRCLAKKPEQRPENMHTLQEALRGLQIGEGNGLKVSAGPVVSVTTAPGQHLPLPEMERRGRLSKWIWLLVAVVVTGALTLFLSSLFESPGEEGNEREKQAMSAIPNDRERQVTRKVSESTAAAKKPVAETKPDAALAGPEAGPALSEEDEGEEEDLDEAGESLSQIPTQTPDKERPQVVILSNPEGAEVFQGTTSLGKTPLAMILGVPMKLVVKHPGYQPVHLTISKDTTGILTADLVEEEEEEQKAEAEAEAQKKKKAIVRKAKPHKKRSRVSVRRKHSRKSKRRHTIRIHSLSKLRKLYQRRRIRRATYRRVRRSLLRQRNRRIAVIARLYKKRKLNRKQYKRYVRAIKRYYR